MKDPEMLEFVLYHLQSKSMCRNEAKKLSFVIKYASECFMTK